MSFNNVTDNPHFLEVKDVTPEEVWENREKINIIDVRSEDEFTGELGHIPGAKLIVLDRLDTCIKDLPQDKPIVFICRSGMRSAKATKMAIDAGLNDTYNMKGDMLAWNENDLETE